MPKEAKTVEDVKQRGNAYHSSVENDEMTQGSSMKPPAFNLETNTKSTDEEKEGDLKDEAADRSGEVNAIGNIIDPILLKFTGKSKEAMKAANQLSKEAKAAQAAAESKAAQALAAQKNAGSGKSKTKNARVSKAKKAAQIAKQTANSKMANAAKAMKEAQKLKSLAPALAKFIDKLPLGQIGFAAAFISKGLTSTNTTKGGVVADATSTAVVDGILAYSLPLTAAVDAVIGLIPGTSEFSISNTLSDSSTAITGSVESVMTGDISGINNFHENSKAGKNSFLFRKAAFTGEKLADSGAKRAETSGEFWGGADSKLGRGAAFTASMPLVGHVGDGVGWAGYQSYDKGKKAVKATGKALSFLDDAIMPEGYTLYPF